MRCCAHWGREVPKKLSEGGGTLILSCARPHIVLYTVGWLLRGELHCCRICCGLHCSYPKVKETFHTNFIGYVDAYPDTQFFIIIHTMFSVLCLVLFCFHFSFLVINWCLSSEETMQTSTHEVLLFISQHCCLLFLLKHG